MRTNHNEFIILSAFVDADYWTNDFRDDRLYGILDDLGCKFKTIEGCYQGTRELSYMVQLEHYKGFTEEFFLEIASKQFDQECILHKDKYNKIYLLYPATYGGKKYFDTYEKQLIGTEFVQCDSTAENYSIIDGKYWKVA